MDMRQPPMQTKLREVAEKCFLRAKNNADKAVEFLLHEVRRNPSLKEELVEPLVEQAAYGVIHSIMAVKRRLIRLTASSLDDTSGLTEIAKRGWMVYCLRDGTPMRMATREMLMTEIHYRRSVSRTMLVDARWMELIADKINKKTVGEVFSERELRELHEKAEKESV